jgi:hypothetical protein
VLLFSKYRRFHIFRRRRWDWRSLEPIHPIGWSSISIFARMWDEHQRGFSSTRNIGNMNSYRIHIGYHYWNGLNWHICILSAWSLFFINNLINHEINISLLFKKLLYLIISSLLFILSKDWWFRFCLNRKCFCILFRLVCNDSHLLRTFIALIYS